MKISIPSLFLVLLAALPLTVAAAEPEVIYWNLEAGKVLRARIAPDEDYWQLIPWFTNQENQTYCGETIGDRPRFLGDRLNRSQQ
jgi:hypothetical protein